MVVVWRAVVSRRSAIYMPISMQASRLLVPANASLAADNRGMPCVSSSMRPAAPVAVAATTALSAAATASRLASRRGPFLPP